ncbi:MAG TPA: glucokinase, partial [Gemmatimonadaceae bacterium]|nr:glucokinase [Gemmatimonadaceae bacterium]
MLLVGDIGGTKTLLGLFRRAARRPEPVTTREFTTLAHPSLTDMVRVFLEDVGPERIEAAAFGVAGVVTRDVARLTNVPWLVEAAEITREFETPSVTLLNDLQAMAYAVPVLAEDELVPLQRGTRLPEGNMALIAAGTGLGEALLHNVDGRYIPSPSEGGHADFAPRTPREIELLVELTRLHGRVDYESVASGLGLVNLFRFTHRTTCPVIGEPEDASDIAPRVTAAGMAGTCASCREALEIFISVYGAEAGNLALRSLATGGVYVGGGIAPKVLPAISDGRFMDAFRSKPPMADLLASMPVHVILNTRTGLL